MTFARSALMYSQCLSGGALSEFPCLRTVLLAPAYMRRLIPAQSALMHVNGEDEDVALRCCSFMLSTDPDIPAGDARNNQHWGVVTGWAVSMKDVPWGLGSSKARCRDRVLNIIRQESASRKIEPFTPSLRTRLVDGGQV